MNHQESLEKLKSGNVRFVSGVRCVEAMSSILRREEFAKKTQRPSSIILTCADSRVPAEIIFDLGLGELFVVRVAGNIVAPSLLASIEFAAGKFGTPLVVVLGHTDCGAVNAAIEWTRTKQDAPSDHIQDLVAEISSSAQFALEHHSSSDQVSSIAALENVRHSVKVLSARSSILRHLVRDGKLRIVGAIYDLAKGSVIFDENPETSSSKVLEEGF